MHFAETMDPPSPIHRDLEHEAILENMIHDAPSVDPAESPSSYLNPSGDGMEVDRSEHEADGSDDGEGDSSDDRSEAGEVYIYMKFGD